MSRHHVGPLAGLPEAEARAVDVAGRRVALVRVDDLVYAIGDRCTHQDISLSEGEVDPDELTLECPKHGSEFSLETGEPCSLPAVRAVPRFGVEVIDGEVWIIDNEEAS